MSDDERRAVQRPNKLELPGWAHYLVATVGSVLLLGPMVAVLWPR